MTATKSNAKPLAILLTVLVGLVLLSATTMGGIMGGPIMGPGMMWGYGSQAGGAAGSWGPAIAMGAGWLMMLAFWGALIVGAILLVRWISGAGPSGGAAKDPLIILQQRYAAGEIDPETYHRMRRELQPELGTRETHDQIRRAS